MKILIIIVLTSVLGSCASLGYWKTEDCKKISETSAAFLYYSGELLKKADEAKKNGKADEAKELAEQAYFLSELAENHAINFNTYCKVNN
tara:strand:+ start:791 stop:1060 length:270 start_codon:yes stop_codon:yes gene_type:complete